MGNIYQAITDIMSEGYAITKDKRNQTQGFMYRGIDDVMNTFQPLLAKHHVFVVPEVIEQQRMERTTGKDRTLLYAILKMRYTFYAEDGSSVSAVVVGEGMDSGDKASNMAMSVAMKYAMFQVFCIPTEEMQDPDADTPEPSTPVPPPEPRKTDSPKPKQPKPEPVKCEVCGRDIPIYQGTDGNAIRPQVWAARTKKVYGKVMCDECRQWYEQTEALRQSAEAQTRIDDAH